MAAGLAAAVLMLPAAAPASPSVEELLARLFASKFSGSYELTAEFAGTLTLHTPAGQFSAAAEGAFKEWQTTGGPRQRKIAVHRLQLPLLLRPFRGALKQLIQDKLEVQSEDPRAFHGHDFFILSTHPDGRYVLIGIHQSIVTDAFDRYGRMADREDPAARRAVARWLFTSPTMRPSIARPGPPYAFEAVVSDAGTLHSLTAFYHWGQVATRFTYTTVSGTAVWKTVAADMVSEVPGLGPVRGHLKLHFTNHCVNC